MKKGGWEKAFRTLGRLGGLRSFIAVSALAVICLSAFSVPAEAAVPIKFTYQGNLRQSGFLVTGTRTMVFRVYASSTAPVPLWTSPSPETVQISTGVFKVTIEPSLPAAGDWESGSLWLELEINGTKMSPREEVTSSPYAVNSLLLGGKRYVTSATTPAGPNTEGDMWMDTTSHTLKFWTGTVWLDTITGSLPGPHAATHDIGGSDPILDLGPHNVSGAITFDSVGEIRVGGTLNAISIAANAIVQSNLSAVGSITGSSVTATGAGLASSRWALANNVIISSEASAALGGGVRISSNVYVDGSVSASRFYGDGSQLTGITATFGDDLGNHVATTTLNMNGYGIVGAASGSFSGAVTASSLTASGAGISASRLQLGAAPELAISSEAAAALGGGVRISSNVYIVGFASATKYYGDGSALTGIVAPGDNLGDHTASRHIAMNGFDLSNAGYITASSAALAGKLVVGGSVTVSGAMGIWASRVGLADNVYVSSETAAALGGGVRVSSNVYIVGFASATAYYGDGSHLTGIYAPGDDLGNHIATRTLDMAGFGITNAGALTASSGSFVNGLYVANVSTLAGNLYVNGVSSFTGSVSMNNDRDIYLSTPSRIHVTGGVSNQVLMNDGNNSLMWANVSALAAGDNLGNHVATATLNMNGHSLVNVASGTFNKSLTVYSTVTVLAPDTASASLWVSTSAASPQLYVSTGGKVGLGTDHPNANLEVAGNGGSGEYITIWKSGQKMAAWLRNK
ncbi:MAG TPA: hypothetical protein PL037_04775 [Elusimicrobiales bacterium]|nr:hypothetical protein [Elusimicrobiales bacterium]